MSFSTVTNRYREGVLEYIYSTQLGVPIVRSDTLFGGGKLPGCGWQQISRQIPSLAMAGIHTFPPNIILNSYTDGGTAST